MIVNTSYALDRVQTSSACSSLAAAINFSIITYLGLVVFILLITVSAIYLAL